MQPALDFAMKAIAVIVAAVLVYFIVGWTIGRRREKCPACGAKKLRCVQFIRATVLIDGQRAPDSWSYLECEGCHAHQKLHRGGFSVVPDDEWQHYCVTLREENA